MTDRVKSLLESRGVSIRNIHHWDSIGSLEIEIDGDITIETVDMLGELVGSRDITLKSGLVDQRWDKRDDAYALVIAIERVS